MGMNVGAGGRRRKEMARSGRSAKAADDGVTQESLGLMVYQVAQPKSAIEIVVAKPPLSLRERPEWRSGRRCLPLVAAGQCGWQLCASEEVRISWSPEEDPEMEIESEGGGVRCLFGGGVATWIIPYLFRTPSGWDLWVRGPANAIKDGAMPLEGIVETSWSVAPFTMSWALTRPGEVRFAAGEPFCQLVPIPHNHLASWTADLVEAPPDVVNEYRAWLGQRTSNVAQARTEGGSAARGLYRRGRSETGTSAPAGAHAKGLSVPPVSDRGAPPGHRGVRTPL